MRFRAKIVHVVVAGLPAAGCTSTDVDPKSTPNVQTPAKTDTEAKKVEPQPKPPEPKPPEPIPPIVVETPDDIPVALGGVAMPYTPPDVSPPKGDAKPAPAPASGAPSAAAPAPAAVAAPSALGAAGSATGPHALALAHDHPAGEPCKPLTHAEVEKALADLRK
jgi:outer membrane biosynthesis protein TonB